MQNVILTFSDDATMDVSELIEWGLNMQKAGIAEIKIDGKITMLNVPEDLQ